MPDTGYQHCAAGGFGTRVWYPASPLTLWLSGLALLSCNRSWSSLITLDLAFLATSTVPWMCLSLSQQHSPAKIQPGVRKEVGTTARYIGHVPATRAHTAWCCRWEMVKALIVARGFYFSSPLKKKKKQQKKPNKKPTKKLNKNHPGRWRAGLAAACVLGLPAPGQLHFYRLKPTTKLRSLNPYGQKS